MYPTERHRAARGDELNGMTTPAHGPAVGSDPHPTLAVRSVAARQIRRVASGAIGQLALVVRDCDGTFGVLPVLLDPDAADEWTVLLDEQQSRLGVRIGVGVAHRFSLPEHVFTACVTVLDPGVFRSIIEAAAAYRHGRPPSSPTGPPVLDALDPRVELLAATVDEFVLLCNAGAPSPASRHQDALACRRPAQGAFSASRRTRQERRSRK